MGVTINMIALEIFRPKGLTRPELRLAYDRRFFGKTKRGVGNFRKFGC